MPLTVAVRDYESPKKQEDLVLGVLNSFEAKFFRKFEKERALEGKPQVLWGWKRDMIIDRVRYPESRTVYFSADLELNDSNQLYIKRPFFFLDTRAKREEIDRLRDVADVKKLNGYSVAISSWLEEKYTDYWRFRLEIGKPTDYDKKTLKRRLKGKPRSSIPKPKLVEEATEYNLSKYAPFALCAGSGLSAESNLPLLGEIHNLFEVDNKNTGKLIFGAEDGLPERLIDDVDNEFKKFCQFSVKVIKAVPSQSHYLLADLYRKGTIRQIFTDNMDDLFTKVDIPYTTTRLSIFPDRYPVKFDEKVKALLVVGVAVDRRDVIKQARYKGLKIIALNPVFDVAPHSRNMDYLCHGDIFFRKETHQALPEIIKASGF